MYLGLVRCLVLGFAVLLIAADWPRFRGPNGTGVADDKNVPIKWSAKEILWSKEVPGKGVSSPIISKGKLFVQSASNDGAKRSLICFDANKGDLLWTKELPGSTAKTHAKNSLASSTPAADGERVYAVFWDGRGITLTAWDYEGKNLWNKELGTFISDHGAGLSPMVIGDKVILNNDQGDMETFGPSEIQAFNAKTGDMVWHKSRFAHRCCYSTPIVLEKKDGTKDLIVSSSGGVTSYNPDNGEINWDWKWNFGGKKILRTVGGPIYSEGMIFAISGDGGGDRYMIALKAEGKGDVTKTGLVWEKKKETSYVPSPIAHEGHLYWVTDKENIAVCVEAKTGEKKWDERLGGGSVSASPILVNGNIYSINETGTVHVFKASPSGYQLVAKNEIGEQVYSSPAVADGKLYIRGQKKLYCIGTK